MKYLNKIKVEGFVLNEIRDLGYSVDNSQVKDVLENAVEFAEIATKRELIQYIEESLELIPSTFLQGDVL